MKIEFAANRLSNLQMNATANYKNMHKNTTQEGILKH